MPTILCVDDEPIALEFLQRTLKEFSLLLASDGEQALQILRTQAIDLIITDQRMPKMTGVELLQICLKEFPAIPRLLITAYGDLPEIVKARADKLVQSVIPKPALPANIRRAVVLALDLPLPANEEIVSVQHQAENSELHLEQTIRLLARQEKVIFRPPPKGNQEPRLELVLEENAELDTLRLTLNKLWGQPWVEPQKKLDPERKKHPVVMALSGIWKKQELWVYEQGQNSYYLAFLPWKKEKKVTAVLGWLGPTLKNARNQELNRLHGEAMVEISGFVLPEMNTSEFNAPEGLVSFEYDWVITKNYVGPDRRKNPTPFFSRFIFWGKRQRVPRSLAQRTISFADRISPLGRWLIFSYILLSMIDTVLTYIFVAKGPLSELNPVMRTFLGISPTFFALAKNAMSLTAIALVVRFEFVKIGWVALWLNVLMYALLDLYWVWVIATLMF